MNKAKMILENLVIWPQRPSVESVEDGAALFSDRQDHLEATHIWLELLDVSCFRKKEYVHIRKFERMTKLDEWIYEHLIDNKEYGQYLDRYRPQKDRLGYEDIDEYILGRHYRPRAVKILKKQKRNFRMDDWTRQRYGWDYERRSNLTLKDGLEYRFDFRNPLETLFVFQEEGLRKILAVGGSGSSGQRLDYTKFTAVFYLLGKKKPIRHHLILYDRFNRFRFLKTYARPIITPSLGSNYTLDPGLIQEMERQGIDFWKLRGKFGDVE